MKQKQEQTPKQCAWHRHLTPVNLITLIVNTSDIEASRMTNQGLTKPNLLALDDN